MNVTTRMLRAALKEVRDDNRLLARCAGYDDDPRCAERHEIKAELCEELAKALGLNLDQRD
jgi:hypothetical protein